MKGKRRRIGLTAALLGLMAVGLTGCWWLFGPTLQAVLVADPTGGPAPLSVDFDPSNSVGTVASYTISFGDGSTPFTGTDITATTTHQYIEPGTYTASLVVNDGKGHVDSDEATIQVTAPEETTAYLEADDTEIPAGGTVEFTMSAFAAEGCRITHWELDADDDGTADYSGDPSVYTLAETATHTYATAGTYTATFTVEDDCGGTATDTVEVEVTALAPEILAFEVAPQTGSATITEFTFTIQAHSDSAITKYVVDFDDGTVRTVESDFGQDLDTTETYTYEEAGTYDPTLTVYDDLGQSTQSELDNVEDIEVIAP